MKVRIVEQDDNVRIFVSEKFGRKSNSNLQFEKQIRMLEGVVRINGIREAKIEQDRLMIRKKPNVIWNDIDDKIRTLIFLYVNSGQPINWSQPVD